MYARKIALSMALLGVFALSGCAAGQAASDPVLPDDRPVSTVPAKGQDPSRIDEVTPRPGIAYNEISFQTVSEEAVPEEVRRLIQEMKNRAGEKTVVIDGVTYAIITVGERSTGGYAVKVLHLGDSEGNLEVVYTIQKPEPGQMVTMALTYPYTVIKFQDGANLPVTFRSVDHDA